MNKLIFQKFSTCRTAECFTQVNAEDDVIRAGVCKYCNKVVQIFIKEKKRQMDPKSCRYQDSQETMQTMSGVFECKSICFI